MYNNRRQKEPPIGITLIRIILALVFITSGFLKGVDPWGGAIKMNDYFSAFGMSWLAGSQWVLSIAQAAFEMWLGLMLLFNQWRAFTRFFVLLFMLFFTGLTLIIALTNPVTDCGCFGEAIKLTNWQTFYKNVVLLPLSLILFWHTKQEMPTDRTRYGTILALAVLALLPNLCAMRSLPWIDFLPYKVGANLPSKVYVAPEDRGESHTTLIYKDLLNGGEREFEVGDTTWYDTARWEFVDTRTVVLSEGKEPEINNFLIFNSSEEITDEVLSVGEVFILVADRLEDVDAKAAERFGRIARFTAGHDIRTIALTTGSLDGEAAFGQAIGYPVPVYNIDATTLKSMLRAHQGLIILNKGTVSAKMNLRQTPDFEALGVGSGLEYVLTKYRTNNEMAWGVIYALILIALAFCGRRRCND